MGPKFITWNFYFMSDFDRAFFIKFIMTFLACVFQTDMTRLYGFWDKKKNSTPKIIKLHWWYNGQHTCLKRGILVDRDFEPQSGQTKDYKIGNCCFHAKHTALTWKSKEWLARNQNNVPGWSDMVTRRLLFQWASTIKFQLSVLF